MRGRLLVIPAAGRGSRLGGDVPKVLAPVAGRPMLDWLLDLYLDRVDAITLVVQPDTREAIARTAAGRAPQTHLAVQEAPTGMLDAVRIGIDATPDTNGRRIWVTWCDQIAVRPETLDRLEREEAGTALCLPTVTQSPPYIHLERDNSGCLVAVRQRREGDPMPESGESDMGVFSMSADAARNLLPDFSAETEASTGTGERNFLPFIPWLAARAAVRTFPATDVIEAVGINTPEDRARVEALLSGR